MKVLIVQHNQALVQLWTRHLERRGALVRVASGQYAATHVMQREQVDIIVIDLMLAEGSALAVADFASYRQPKCRVVFVTDAAVFSDGSIFRHCGNACAYLPSATAPADLVAMIEHYGGHHPL